MKDSSAIIKKLARHQTSGTPSPWPSRFILSTGAILALVGTNTLFDILGKSTVWDLKDPLIGVSWRYLFLAAGLLELLVAWLCLFTDKKNLGLGLSAWLAANSLSYRGGLWSTGRPHQWVLTSRLTNVWDISPRLADGIMIAVAGYVLAGSVILLLCSKATKTSPVQADNFKLHCPSCGGKTAFEARWLGQITPCPHCGKPLTMAKPA